MAEVRAQLEYVPALDEREIIAIFVGCLDLAQGVAESIFAEVKEVVA